MSTNLGFVLMLTSVSSQSCEFSCQSCHPSPCMDISGSLGMAGVESPDKDICFWLKLSISFTNFLRAKAISVLSFLRMAFRSLSWASTLALWAMLLCCSCSSFRNYLRRPLLGQGHGVIWNVLLGRSRF